MLRVQEFTSIQEIEQEAWQAIADPRFPFTHYHFLRALETSGCLFERTGWYPRFVTAWRDKKLVAAIVCYLKTNSYGEYIFDFAWANAYESCGLPYYPKFVSAVPFTPATGPKLLGADGEGLKTVLQAAHELATRAGASSEHLLFVPEGQLESLNDAGFFTRHSFQYHWFNKEYSDFAGFLTLLTSKRRKEISRERRQVVDSGLRVHRLTGRQIFSEHADLFYEFYLSTIDKRSSYDYLTREFFQEIFLNMPEQLLLVLARDKEDRTVAGALYFVGEDALYGRNWGAFAEYRQLHFELCYYQGIEFAIERGLKRFEAGAQGEHKFNRGFMPTLTYSAHRIAQPQLDRAIRDFVEVEAREIARALREYEAHSPYAARSIDKGGG